MDSISKIAAAHEFLTFIRKWGSRVSYKIADEQVTEIQSNNQEAEMEFQHLASHNLIGRRHPPFTSRIHPMNGTFWVWDDDILRATEKHGMRSKLVKFSWDPRTGDFYFVPVGQQHSSVKMNAPFDDYVRGIILHDRNLVSFRPIWPSWAHDDDDMELLNFDAQHSCKSALEENGSTGWNWQFNVTNQILEEMTGNHRW